MTMPETESSGTNKTNINLSHRSNEKPPKYREGDNLQNFFKLYELTAELNGWNSNEEKLARIHTSFKGKLQEWVVSQVWESCDAFKCALCEREEVVTKDDMHYLTKLLNGGDPSLLWG